MDQRAIALNQGPANRGPGQRDVTVLVADATGNVAIR